MPKPPVSDFNNRFLLLNDLDSYGFKEWSFLPGMIFAAEEKWWGDNGDRPDCHEGIDLVTFIDYDNKERQLTAGMRIPPLFKGRVVDIIDDLLGSTIIIDHFIINTEGLRLYAFYAHLVIDIPIYQGSEVSSGDTLGLVAPGNKNCPAHLHISTAWCSGESQLNNFSWDDHFKKPNIEFSDPREII